MSETDDRKIIIHGSGSTACVTALALSQARMPVVLADAPMPQEGGASAPEEDWQSVLALSPAAKTMLQTLGIWQKLDRPSAPICDMAVFGDKAAYATGLGLAFAANAAPKQNAPENQNDVNVLAHIVSRAALDRAIKSTCQQAFTGNKADNKIATAAALTAFDKTSGQAHFADGTTLQADLLVDCARIPASWRRDSAAQALRHDYHADALVCAVEGTLPHGHQAVQIFTADGPLALLPLPDAHQRALIWSLPRRRAAALAAIDAGLFAYELAKATGAQAGTLQPITARAVQPLRLALAENYVDEKLCLLGEAAHIIHPLAGQGFNLALRDAAQLADALFQARRLGLAYHAPAMLDDYQKLRRGDGGMMAMTTHMLAEMFSGKAAPVTRPLARLGLAFTGRLAAISRLNDAFRNQANGGIGHADLPRLMRGQAFEKI